MEQNIQIVGNEPQPDAPAYQHLKALGTVLLASGALLIGGNAGKAQAEDTAPVALVGNAPTFEAQNSQAGDDSQREYQKDTYCIQEGLYSFGGGWIGYGKSDRKGQFRRVRQHVEADSLSEMCKDRVTREVGVRQMMNGRPNTDYRVVSKAPGEIDKTVNQRGYRTWECFKRFRQQVFVTVTTDEGYGQRKIYNGRSSKPNC